MSEESSRLTGNPLAGGNQKDDMFKRMHVSGHGVIGRPEGESRLAGFRHAVAVPASCDCSSDAHRSVWQSSSCSFAYGCCRDTENVKEGGEKRGA